MMYSPNIGAYHNHHMDMTFSSSSSPMPMDSAAHHHQSSPRGFSSTYSSNNSAATTTTTSAMSAARASPPPPLLSALQTYSSQNYLHHPTTMLTSTANNNHHHHHHHHQPITQCLKFKYFTTFFVCTTCLALLAGSLATHKWLVSRPIRVLKMLANGQQQQQQQQQQQHQMMSNITALMLSVAADSDDSLPAKQQVANLLFALQDLNGPTQTSPIAVTSTPTTTTTNGNNNNKFQGEIYFGLFNGVKVLNYGFGNRVSHLSIIQTFSGINNKESPTTPPNELINFKLWLTTLIGVVLAILFALIGSIFAIINFVMTPRGTLAGPVGLVVWNASACFACLIAVFAWLVEYYLRLKANVLTQDEINNGWTSENRSQFGYSYYFVLLAFVLHLVNIFIVSLVQFETWTSQKAAKRHLHSSSRHHTNSSSNCEGVIMLY